MMDIMKRIFSVAGHIRGYLFALCSLSAFFIVGYVSATPIPQQVSGPVPVTAETGEPFRGTNAQPVAGPGLPPPMLQPYDFTEEEYFVSGTVDGTPYSTSILVRKPRDPSKFSGVVAVETIHAAGAIPFWGTGKAWLEGNHGWVAVASQKAALDNHLKRVNPERYAELDIPSVAGATEGGVMSAAQDKLSQAIMVQIGAMLKSNPGEGPFAGYSVQHLLMGGSSQTGGTTLRFIRDSHDQARMPDGSPIYDGYAPWLSYLDEPVSAPGSVIVHLVAEGDVNNYLLRDRPMAFGADSDDRQTGGYRHYQIAGASHVGTRGPAADGLRAFGTLDNVSSEQDLSGFPLSEVLTPANVFLADWVTKGTAPPIEASLVVEDGEIQRDEHGIAKGGVRSAYVDVPTVRYITSIPPDGSLFGLEEAFSKEKLRGMYGSREGYLERFNRHIDGMVAAGWLFPDDAERLKKEEAERELF